MSRGSFGNYDGGYSSYHSGGGGTTAPRDTSNEFTRLSQVVGNNVQKISQNVAQIQRMVNQIGTAQDSGDLRDRLHQITHYTNQLAKETSKYLRDLSSVPSPPNQSEQRQRKMQKERLVNEFSSALNNFQAAQRSAAEKEKASVARARANSGLQADPFLDDRRRDDQLVNVQGSRMPPAQVQIEADVDLEMLQEREQAIKKLESDIMDVNQIFKDLGVLVHEQGEVIDSIEANVENTQVHVEEGTQQLAKARDYQSKARRKKCCIITIVIIVLAIIITILAVTLSRK